ncbi:DedA family protein [Actinoplanes sp. NPDC049265]|uniref:DedA family protein n=1 Tax=Actinoplanes sp. NPDC049265 TaxID=3363902 RepID=UPI003714F3DB
MLDHLMPLISSPWLYVIVFVAVAIDGFIPIMPSETVVIGLGALSATGRPSLAALATAVIAGGMAGDRVSYWLGRQAGGRIRNGKLAMAKEKAERALLRYGGAAILAGRFLPYGRTATTTTAGSVRLPIGRFTLFSGLASAAWAAYAIGLGWIGGATFAGSPLLGTAFGLVLGSFLAIVHTVAERRRRPAPETRALPAEGGAVAERRRPAPEARAVPADGGAVAERRRPVAQTRAIPAVQPVVIRSRDITQRRVARAGSTA